MNQSRAGAIKVWSPQLQWEKRDDGCYVIWRVDPLGPHPDKITERMVHWATVDPNRIWMAERDDAGGWRKLSYGEALRQIRALGQLFLDNDLSAERPVLILSDNSIAHALVALAAQYVGVPSAAIAPAYATHVGDFGKLADIAGQVTPGLVFADDVTPFAAAIEAVFAPSVPLLFCRNAPSASRPMIGWDEALATAPGSSVDEAYAAVGPDTVAKFLFTSGTTGSPKAVIQTQRMLCSNQEMVADCYAFLRDDPPIVVDWAPWNHTASGNKVFNMVIYNGGTFYIDKGRPTPAAIGETIANLKEVSPTWFFNVPAGYEMLIAAMRKDDQLRESFFRNLKFMLYAGAGMAQHTWDDLMALSEQTLGYRVFLGTGLGATETSPFALFCTEPQDAPGNIGIPSQGITLKLVPFEEKFELRLKGPNVTPGYWRNPTLTAAAFDEEGFYRIGDAVRFAVPDDPTAGFFFDGRTAENFKLQTGTWVAVGKLRAQLVDQFGGLIRDAVITAPDREDLGALVIPFLPALRPLVPGGDQMSDAELLARPEVRAALADKLKAHAKAATGSASRVVRIMIMTEPPRFDRGEVTDKGSINQRAVLSHRKDLVEALYEGGPDVIGVK
ncbi:feruloyl-CoA synthase [Ciceribacter sp. L1K23]|uniref:feruloyl-CoA synthase n=1 Tax=Ciceribacter sp. L1K23 TaxID=2820276 RepID=UPI001B842178|nr:feruloyl-CoA synthase [Ciceribacter sp. L1K23]MBR0557424.1 feruloyl-CoA synthase [Ciceribacter sp. L1K23]